MRWRACDGLAHALGVVEVAQRGDADGQRVVASDERRAVLLERQAVAAVPLDAVEGRHVRARAGGEHEAVVGEPLAVVERRRCAARGRSRSPATPVSSRTPAALEVGAIGDGQRVELGVADGVLGDQHAVVGVDGLGSDDGELDPPVAHGGEQVLGEACADRPVADERRRGVRRGVIRTTASATARTRRGRS